MAGIRDLELAAMAEVLLELGNSLEEQRHLSETGVI